MVIFSRFTLNIKIYEKFVKLLFKLVWRETLFLVMRGKFKFQFLATNTTKKKMLHIWLSITTKIVKVYISW